MGTGTDRKTGQPGERHRANTVARRTQARRGARERSGTDEAIDGREVSSLGSGSPCYFGV